MAGAKGFCRHPVPLAGADAVQPPSTPTTGRSAGSGTIAADGIDADGVDADVPAPTISTLTARRRRYRRR
jgi:hypothetical protein